jgi:cytochrome c biogenesis protein CcmG, thiol:disulfide interchange protein DsbE
MTATHERVGQTEPTSAQRRGRHRLRWVAIGFGVVVIALAVVLATRPSSQATQVDSPLLGHSAPAFSTSTLSGQAVTLTQYRGEYVFLNFFASWCAPCQSETPEIEQFSYEQSKMGSGAQVLGIVFQDSDAAARSFTTSAGATWPAASDPGGSIANDFGVTAPPTTFLINPQGEIVGELSGPVTSAQLNAMLASARSKAG